MSESERLVVLVPCFNEQANIVATMEAIAATEPTLDLPLEVIMIDDGSTDRTRERMQECARRFGFSRIRVNEENLGLGRSVMQTYDELEADDWVTVLPGDNEIAFRSIRNLLRIRADYDIVLGYLQNPVIRPLRRRVASFAFSQVIKALYGFPYRYLNGLKLYRVRCFRGLQVLSTGHAYVAELLAKAVLREPSIRIGEAPFVARGRRTGVSKAFSPQLVVEAVWETFRAKQSVDEFRERVIREE